jgi:hypothetical protein
MQVGGVVPLDAKTQWRAIRGFRFAGGLRSLIEMALLAIPFKRHFPNQNYQ